MIKKYMPILKGKTGEFTALKNLSEDVKKKIIPLIEVDPVDIDFETGEPKKTYNDHLAGYAKKFQGINIDTYLIDASLIEEEYIDESDDYPLDNIFQQLSTENIKAVPVISLDCSKNYRDSVKKLVDSDLVLRLTMFDLLSPNDIIAFLLDFEVTPDQVHLIMDFQYVDDDESHYKNMIKALKAIPKIDKWKNIILSAGSFPVNLSVLDRGITSIPRIEWIVWESLFKSAEYSRNFVYSDYGIQHPEYKRSDIDPKFANMTASIRYTGENDFTVIKGKSARRFGYDQFGDHCQSLIKRPEYSGKDFSDADKQIYLYAEKRDAGETKGFGNATTWRWIGANHHITLVVNQLSS